MPSPTSSASPSTATVPTPSPTATSSSSSSSSPSSSSTATIAIGDTARQKKPPKLVKVLEKRQNSSKGLQYYIHYVDYDRRNDRWVSADQLEAIPPEELQAQTTTLSRSPSPVASSKRMTRRGKRRDIDSMTTTLQDPEDLELERAHEERTKVKYINRVEFGQYEVDTWYFSPYPTEYRSAAKLYVCEFCLKYMKSLRSLLKHKPECKLKHPPGDEIYRDDNISVWEIDGAKQKLYCQCLCLLAKLFIDHKTLYYDVEPFLFYILTTHDKDGYHIVGYFSKEKKSAENYNLACILTFPQFQRCGYGKFLISFSYELSKIEQKVGSPEKPLSDLGKVSYRSYWTRVLLQVLKYDNRNLSIKEVSDMTSIKPEDIISTLQFLGLVKYVKGQHVIAVTPRLIEQHEAMLGSPPKLLVDPGLIQWVPKAFPAAKKPKRSSSLSGDAPREPVKKRNRHS